MKERVEQVRQQRETAARGRDRRLWPTVGIVGYTNAGQVDAAQRARRLEVAQAEDKLFATLDPTSRRSSSATVRRDRHRHRRVHPQAAHQLVDAFRATLEEVNRADVLSRSSTPPTGISRAPGHGQTVLDELGAGDKPGCSPSTRPTCWSPPPAIRTGPRRRSADACSCRPDGLRDGHPPRGDRRAARLDVGRCRHGRCRTPPASSRPRRERGAVELDYRERDVRVTGRVAPALAGELVAVAERWARLR
jgi:hypothetical protein